MSGMRFGPTKRQRKRDLKAREAKWVEEHGGHKHMRAKDKYRRLAAGVARREDKPKPERCGICRQQFSKGASVVRSSDHVWHAACIDHRILELTKRVLAL